jgi:hypothetical protein
MVDPQAFMVDSIDLDLEDFPIDTSIDGTAAQTLEDVFDGTVEEVAEACEAEMSEDQDTEDAVEDVDDDLPFFDEPEPVFVPEPLSVNDAVQVSVKKPVVLDAMAAKQAWRTDMPGAPVRDVRSAISLNDRVLFINRLFDEDPVKFQETLNALNQMVTLDEAVAYLVESHPSWNLESELVYRFMMALRRKLN